MQAANHSLYIRAEHLTAKVAFDCTSPLHKQEAVVGGGLQFSFLEVGYNGKFVAAATEKGIVHLVNGTSGALIKSFELGKEIESLYFSETGRFLVIATRESGKAESLVIDVTEMKEVKFEHNLNNANNRYVCFTYDDDFVVSQVAPNETKIYNDSLELISTMSIFPSRKLNGLSYRQEPLFYGINEEAVVENKKGAIIEIYKVGEEGAYLSYFFEEYDELVPYPSPCGEFLLIKYGKNFDATGENYYGTTELCMLKMKTRNKKTIQTYFGRIHSISWRPDGEMYGVITGSSPANITLYQSKGEPFHLLAQSDKNYLSWSPNSIFLAVGGFDDRNGEIEVWDINRFKVVGKFSHPVAGAIKWAPDGYHFLSENNYNHIKQNCGYKVYAPDGRVLVDVEFPNNNRLYSVEWLPGGMLKQNVLLAEVREVEKSKKKIVIFNQDDDEDFMANLKKSQNKTSVKITPGPINSKNIKEFNAEIMKKKGIKPPPKPAKPPQEKGEKKSNQNKQAGPNASKNKKKKKKKTGGIKVIAE